MARGHHYSRGIAGLQRIFGRRFKHPAVAYFKLGNFEQGHRWLERASRPASRSMDQSEVSGGPRAGRCRQAPDRANTQPAERKRHGLHEQRTWSLQVEPALANLRTKAQVSLDRGWAQSKPFASSWRTTQDSEPGGRADHTFRVCSDRRRLGRKVAQPFRRQI